MKGIKLDSRQITKALIIIGTVLTLIYIVHLMTSKKEKNANSYFNTPNPSSQKIMTVNQSTGEINFLDKSVKTLNDDLVNDYATIKNAMVVLLGENLRGDTEGKIYELSRDKAPMTRVTDIEDELYKFHLTDTLSEMRAKIAANTGKPTLHRVNTVVADTINSHLRSRH